MRLNIIHITAVCVLIISFSLGFSLSPNSRNLELSHSIYVDSDQSTIKRFLASANACEANFRSTPYSRMLSYGRKFGPAFQMVKSAKNMVMERALNPLASTFKNAVVQTFTPVALPAVLTVPFADNKGLFFESVQKAVKVIHDYSYEMPQNLADAWASATELMSQVDASMGNTGVDEALLAAAALGYSLKIIDESAERFLKHMAKLSPVLVIVFASVLTNAPELGAAIMSAIRDGVLQMAVATPGGSNFYNPALLSLAVIMVAFISSGKWAPLFGAALTKDTINIAKAEGIIEQNTDVSELSRGQKLRVYSKGFRAMIAKHFKRGWRELGFMAPSILSASYFFFFVQHQLDGPHAMAWLASWAIPSFAAVYSFFAVPAFSTRGQTESLADSVEEDEDFDSLLDAIEKSKQDSSIDEKLQAYHEELYNFIAATKRFNDSGEGSETFKQQIQSLKTKLADLGEETRAHFVETFREATEDPFLLGILDKVNLGTPKLSLAKWFKGSWSALLWTLVTGGGVAIGSMGIDVGANLFVDSTSHLGKTGFGAFINSFLTSLPDAAVAASLLFAGASMGAFRSVRFSNYTNLIIAFIASGVVLYLH